MCVCVCAIGANDVLELSKSATTATLQLSATSARVKARAIGSKTFRAPARQVAAPPVVYYTRTTDAVDDRAAIFFFFFFSLLRCIRMHVTSVGKKLL